MSNTRKWLRLGLGLLLASVLGIGCSKPDVSTSASPSTSQGTTAPSEPATTLDKEGRFFEAVREAFPGMSKYQTAAIAEQACDDIVDARAEVELVALAMTKSIAQGGQGYSKKQAELVIDNAVPIFCPMWQKDLEKWQASRSR